MNLAELPKQYAPQDAQRRWYQFWLDKGYFHADVASRRKPFCMVIPPPNVTGACIWVMRSTTRCKTS